MSVFFPLWTSKTSKQRDSPSLVVSAESCTRANGATKEKRLSDGQACCAADAGAKRRRLCSCVARSERGLLRDHATWCTASGAQRPTGQKPQDTHLVQRSSVFVFFHGLHYMLPVQNFSHSNSSIRTAYNKTSYVLHDFQTTQLSVGRSLLPLPVWGGFGRPKKCIVQLADH